jgi:hypothetical protein
MEELDGEIRRAGAAAVGPGQYALGRGYLALDDDAKARAHLEAAWQDGFREPRVTYALALVMGHLYQQNLLAAERIESKDLRDAKKRELERQYRDPALAYLAASKGAEVPSTEYVAALVAFYEGHLDAAPHHLDAIGGGRAWFYEAPELRGDILLARALTLRDQGDSERARSDFEAGRKAYAAAITVGESVSAVHESLGELEYAAMAMELYGQDLAPENLDYKLAFGQFCRAWAALQQEMGRDPGASLPRGLALANQVLATRPAWPDAQILRATLLVLQAQRPAEVAERRERGTQAADDFARALAIHPALEKVWKRQVTQAQQLATAFR